MTIPFRRTSLHIHPLFLSLIIFCLLTGRLSVLHTVLSLLLHECGHLVFLILFKKTPSQISLTPFGGLMEMPPDGTLPTYQTFFIALGGPFFSLLGCVFCFVGLWHGFLSVAFAASFFRSNLLLCLFNLLPVLPLDGGRMAQALLSLFLPANSTRKALLILSHLLSVTLIGLSVFSAMHGEYQFSPAFAGAYLMYAAGAESRQSPLRYYTSLMSRRSASCSSFPVQHLAVRADTPLYALPPRLKDHCLHLLQVVNEDGMELLGTLTDNDLLSHLFENSRITAREALQLTKKQRS